MNLFDNIFGISLEDNLLFKGVSFLFFNSMTEFTYEFQMGFFKFSVFLASFLIVILHVRKNMRDGEGIGSAIVGFFPYIFTLAGTYVICLIAGWFIFHHVDSAAMIYSFFAYVYLLIYTLIDNSRIKKGII